MPYERTVRTASGATAVQIVHSSHRGSRDIEHLGSAHDDAEVELLKAAARQRLAAGQGELDLGLDAGAPGGPLPITASRMGCLLDALEQAWRVLGLDDATRGDQVFFDLVAARIIEPVSKLDSLRVLEEAGVAAASYRTVLRRLPAYAKDSWRQTTGIGNEALSAGCKVEKFGAKRQRYISRFFTSSAFSSMNLRRASTSSPISVVKIDSQASMSSAFTESSVRRSGSMVVCQSCSELISPSPL